MGESTQLRKVVDLIISPESTAIYGELDSEGEVTFVVTAGEGASIRGTKLFDIMMDAFGDEAKAIRGVWRKGSAGKPSINIDKVNELTAKGMPIQEAVLFAWTVTRARRRGFDQVSVETSVGDPGAFTKIDVLIRGKSD